MSRDRLTRADLVTIAVAVLLGVVGVAVFLNLYNRANPEASIDFEVSRPEIEQRARDFLTQRGLDLDEFPHTLVLFRYDAWAKTYLERELELEEANRIMASEINVWRWKVRFFKPPEKEELIVWLDPAGRLVGFEHVVGEEAPGARLDKIQAQGVAEIFLYAQLGLDLGTYRLVEDSAEERPERLDYSFTWERNDFKAKDATYRIAATVQGDQIGRALPFLKVPEQWDRDYRLLRSRNETLQTASNLLAVPLLVAIAFVLLPRIRQRRLRWKPLLWFGGACGAVLFVSQINQMPLNAEFFPTATPYPEFVVGSIVQAALVGVGGAILVALLAAAGSAVYREIAPDKVAVSQLFTFQGVRTKEFFRGTIVGLALAGAQLGLIAVFYVVARRFGAWSPAEVPYDNFLSTTLPWVYPLTIALWATTTEEFIFRLFAVSFLKKYLKSTWLAVVIPAIIWGFAHSGYPQQPAWIRGVEVGIVGVIFGFVFLRYGILPVLVAHYTYNAVQISLPLLRSGDFYFLVTGGLVMDLAVIPLAIAGVFYWQHRRFAADRRLFNATREDAAPVAAPETEVESRRQPAFDLPAAYKPLASNRLVVAASAGLIGLLVWWFVPLAAIGDYVSWKTGPGEAETIGDQYVRDLGVAPEDWKRTINQGTPYQPDEAEYIRRLGGIEAVNELWSTRLPMRTTNWRIRYVRPLQSEAYTLFVSPEGDVRHYHYLEETAPGAELSEAEAVARGVDYVSRTYGLPVDSWKLVEVDKNEREHRLDYTLIWEDPEPVIGDAHVRVRIYVTGDEPAGFMPYLKVPDAWYRDLVRPSIQQMVGGGIILLAAIALLVAGALRMPGHRFRWRLYVGFGVLVAAFGIVGHLNGLRALGSDYDTRVAWGTYLFQNSATAALIIIGFASLAVVVALFADLFFLGGRRDPLRAFLPLEAASRSAYYRDALVVGLSGALVVLGLGQIGGYIAEVFSVPMRMAEGQFGMAMDAYLPGLGAGLVWVQMALLIVGLTGVGLAALANLRSVATRTVVAVLVVGGMLATGSVAMIQFGFSAAMLLVMAGVVYLGVRYTHRCNLLAYLVTAAFAFLIPVALYYWSQPLTFFKWNAVLAVVTAVGLLLMVMALLRWSAAAPPNSTSANGVCWGTEVNASMRVDPE